MCELLGGRFVLNGFLAGLFDGLLVRLFAGLLVCLLFRVWFGVLVGSLVCSLCWRVVLFVD